MFKSLMNILINLVASLIQVVTWPLNQAFIVAFPYLSITITNTSSTLVSMFDGMGWAVGLIPTPVKACLITILGLEIAKHSVYVTTHGIVKVWNLIQKIKFW